MKLYPVMLNMEKRLAAIIGGGGVGYRKVKDLLDAGAKIKIVAPELHQGIIKLADKNPGLIEIVQREYQSGDLDGAMIVFSATDDPELNARILFEAEAKGIFVNAVDDPPNCTFFVPSHARRGDLLLAVSTGGSSPAMAAKIRRILEDHIPENIEKILKALREARTVLQKKSSLSSSQRGSILKTIANDDSLIKKLTEYHKKNKIEKFLDTLI